MNSETQTGRPGSWPWVASHRWLMVAAVAAQSLILTPMGSATASAADGVTASAPHAIVWTAPGVGISSCPGPTPPGFAACNAVLSVAPSSQALNPGGSAQYSVELRSADPARSSATLSVAGAPRGVSVWFQPATLSPTTSRANATLTLTVARDTKPGMYPIQVIASGPYASEPKVHAQTVLRVDPA